MTRSAHLNIAIRAAMRAGDIMKHNGGTQAHQRGHIDRVHTLDWRQRKIKKAASADMTLVNDVLARLMPLLGAQA